jgi:hypothetical protein
MKLYATASFYFTAGALALTLATVSQGHAAITVYMDGWDRIPLVVVSLGSNQDCGANQIVFNGPLTRRQSVGTFNQAGTHGVDICWRRTADPLDSTSPLQTVWTRCSSDGACIIS